MGSCLSADLNHRAVTHSDLNLNLASASPHGGFVTRRRSSRKKKKKKKPPSPAYDDDDDDDDDDDNDSSSPEIGLHRVPGRMFLNGTTHHAALFSKQGTKGINQDSMILWENFGSKEDTIFCGVFDGHGPFGHMVSKKVRDSLPLKLCAQLELELDARCKASPPTLINNECGGCEGSHNHICGIKQSLLKGFKVMEKELKLHPYIDCHSSGTTAVALLKQGPHLVIANVGDSRAVLGTRDHHNLIAAVQLTQDLKPNLPREAERIRLCKGRIFALKNEPATFRVWLPNRDSPGLAMARSFGDFCLKDFGLIALPDISSYHLTEKDQFVVLATDGVWDVLSNEEVVAIVASSPRSSAARKVVDSANRAWRLKYPTAKVDDCTVVCLYLDSNGECYGDS